MGLLHNVTPAYQLILNNSILLSPVVAKQFKHILISSSPFPTSV